MKRKSNEPPEATFFIKPKTKDVFLDYVDMILNFVSFHDAEDWMKEIRKLKYLGKLSV